jgi:hypothetical protein
VRSSAAWWLAAALLGAGVQAQQAPDAAASAASAPDAVAGRPSRDQIETEIATLRADPRFGGSTKQKTWRFKPHDAEPKKPEPPGAMPGWFKWLREFAGWVTAAGRLVVWTLGAVLVALLIVGLRYWIRERAGALPQRAPPLPSHVRDLDIRPESLPDRIGPAAAALWQRGEQRAALSLLYRGALSRLVHVHALPVRAASTEGECVALARERLRAEPAEYVARLVSAWQLAVYGARLPPTEDVLALCDEFDARLQAPAALAGAAAAVGTEAA